ncbi:unnamed protein product [Calicophoron daubneyi]|uniref:Uncharacterized protein n=1 Tax=Calicophoron daubneyi TaxID=300641 RepID=A0AAV2TN46_CALDB
MDEGVIGTRKLSARRSKPDMAALVDQQRFIFTEPSEKFSYAEHSQHIAGIPVCRAGDFVELQDTYSKDEPLSSSDTSDSVSPQSLLRKRSVHHGEHIKRLKKSRHTADVNGNPCNNAHDPEDSECIRNNVEVTNDVKTYLSTVVDELDGDIDEDDDVPLSTFVHHKPVVPTTLPPHSPPPSPPSSVAEAPTDLGPPLCYCTKPAVVDDPRWDGEFCSSECAIALCHHAFDLWLRVHHHPNGGSNVSA